MRRRDFIKTVAGSAVAWPLAARAQQPDRMRRIGVLMGFAESDREGQAFVAAFREGLQKLGWAEGRNIRIDYRWTALDKALIQQFVEGTRCAAARPHSYAKHARHRGAATTNTYHPHRFRARCRSDRQRLRREFSAAGRQRHRFRHDAAHDGWKVAGVTQRDFAACRPGRDAVQPGNGAICRILVEPLQSRCCVLRCAGDCRSCSRHVRARTPLLPHTHANRMAV